MRMKWAAMSHCLMAVVVTAGVLCAPIRGTTQNRRDREDQHRQQTKNDWRNIGTGSALVSLLGLVKGDSTLTFLGAAGALYSANRYEQDRKSQNSTQRARAEMFRRQSYDRNGHHYVRQNVKKNGQNYYQFVQKDRH